MKSEILISNRASRTTIEIEGIIGISESVQFDNPEEKIATYERFEESLRQIKAINARKVLINIRSTGGNMNDALLIYDAIKALGVEITTRCYGYVASAATIIAQAASKGCREISANSLYLIHCCESACEGNSRSLSITKDLLDKSDLRIAEIYSLVSGREIDSFVALMNENGGKGRWLSPKEVVEAGLADRVIASTPISNDITKCAEKEGFPPLPKHEKQSLMLKITEHWKAILNLLGLTSNTSLQDENLDVIENSLATLEQQKVENKLTIETLQNRIERLEQVDEKLASAKPTVTKQKEDPTVGEIIKTKNQTAYEADIEGFMK